MFRKLPDALQKKVVRPALKDSSERLREKIVQKLARGTPVGIVERKLLGAFEAATPGVRMSRGLIVGFVPQPDDAETAIQANAIEYGWTDPSGKKNPPRSFIRSTVDENAASERAKIGDDVGKGVVKQARKLAKR